MPSFALHVTATLEGAARVLPGPHHALRICFTCTSCRETQPRPSVFCFEDEVEVPDKRDSVVSLLQKCVFCERALTVKLTSTRAQAQAVTPETPRALSAVRECRGCEPATFEPGDNWRVEGPSGQGWDAALNDDEFCEYDETGDVPVLVTGVAGAFSKA